jgi:branched-chain amino acid transport system substrate-binding protein
METRRRRWIMRIGGKWLGTAVLVAFAVLSTQPVWPAEEVKVGAIMDITGATSDVGKDYALAIREAIQYVNDQGGINGKPIKLFLYDYGYRIPEAITTYKRLKNFDRVIAVLGWGTGDTESLSPIINKDTMPYVSASYSAHLTDPKKTPYNLFFSADYSTNARACLTAWYNNVWMKEPAFKERRDKKEKPRLVCFYMFASPYASAPIKAIKDQAQLLGFDVGDDQDVSLTALDTKSQVLAAAKFKPDVVWHGNTTMSVSTAIKDAYAQKLGAGHIINNWGFDENLPRLAGEAANNVIGATPCAFFGENVKLMDKVVAYAQKLNPSVPKEQRLIRSTQAWGAVMLLWEAMKLADKAGKFTGEGIMKVGFESLKGYDLGLGAPPVTFTPEDHRPTSIAQAYIYKDGKFQLLERIDFKQKWPEKWAKEWLGW